jgi:predicted phage terminase large subunit-like protein
MSRAAGFLVALQAEMLRRSFVRFVDRYWPVVTGAPYVANRVTTTMIAALQLVGEGKTSRLVISKPPGCGASTLLVLFRAWRFGRDPSWRTMAASHSYELAATASRRVRRLVTSPEFRRLFPVQLRDDAAQIGLWETAAGGHFIAVGRESNVTGRRGNEIVCDDLNAAADRHSKAALEHAWLFFAETLSTRVDNDRAAMVVCAQRTAVDDVPGRLAEQGGWTVVSIPAEDESGEPTAPNVLPRERLDAIKAQIGSLAYSTQYLQRPADDSTALIRRSWWRFYRPAHVSEHAPRPAGCDAEAPAVAEPDTYERVVIAADLTFGSPTGDFVAIQAWGARRGGRYLLDRYHARVGFEDSCVVLEAMARRYPGSAVLIEKAANGAAVIEALRARIAGVIALKPRGSKAARLSAIAPAVESGACYLPLGAAWLPEFVEELAGASKHDDEADACAYAIAELANGWQDDGFTDGPSAILVASEPAVSVGERVFATDRERQSVFANFRPRRALVGGALEDLDPLPEGGES